MLPPFGLLLSQSNQVCKLTKSFYYLKQDNKQWHSKLSSFLFLLDLFNQRFDHSPFVRRIAGILTTLLVYVDDAILTRNFLTNIEQIKSCLDNTFNIKNLGELKYFLDFEDARTKEGIYLCQRKYALDILLCQKTMFYTYKES